VVGDAIWLVEFYAPWCSACGTFVEPFKTIAKNLEEDHIEVGAVNCAKEKTLCSEYFAVTSYPMIMMVGSSDRGTQQIYSQKDSKNADSVTKWARQVAEEWSWLYSQAVFEPISSNDAFDALVLASTPLWFVVFTDGL
jgi:thioredoxin-like negative regulator of GroEL